MAGAKHVCTKSNPMRVSSNPDDWRHPDAVEEPDTYVDTSSMAELLDMPAHCVGPTVTKVCPHCGQGEDVRVPSRGIVGGFDPELRGRAMQNARAA